MANAFYYVALDDVPLGANPPDAGTLTVTLVGTGYTFSPSHTTLADLGSNVLAGVTDQALGTLTITDPGVYSGPSITFSGVTAGQTVKAIILYLDEGGGTTKLIGYFDTGVGFPYVTTGSDITIDWNATAGSGTVYTATSG